MKYKYDCWETAPMRFYRMLMTLLPLVVVTSLYSAVTSFTQWRKAGAASSPYFWIEVFFRVLMLAVLVIAMLKLRRRKWNGVWFFLVYVAVGMMYSVLSNILFSSTGMPIGDIAWIIFGSLVVMALIYLYFYKRRPLFDPFTESAARLPSDARPADGDADTGAAAQ